MSAPTTRRVSLGAILLAVAVIAACSDASTAPRSSLTPHAVKASVDTSDCHSGWSIQEGKVVCYT